MQPLRYYADTKQQRGSVAAPRISSEVVQLLYFGKHDVMQT